MRERDGEKVKRSERNKEKRAEEKDKRGVGWGGGLELSCLRKKKVLSPVWFKPEREKQHLGHSGTGFFPFLIPGASPQMFPSKAQASLRNVQSLRSLNGSPGLGCLWPA